MNLEILKRDQGSTYVAVTTVLTTTWLGKDGKAAAGGYWGVVITEPRYVLPVLEWDDVMRYVKDE